MKKTIALVAAVCTLGFANAQDQMPANTSGSTKAGDTQQQKPKGPKPEIMAQRHSRHLQKLLTLTEDQTNKTYTAMVTRFTESEAIREKAGPNPDRKALHEQLKPVRQKFVQTMNGILTPEQKTKWEVHRKQMKEQRMKRRIANGEAPPPPPADGKADPKKSIEDEDGLDN